MHRPNTDLSSAAAAQVTFGSHRHAVFTKSYLSLGTNIFPKALDDFLSEVSIHKGKTSGDVTNPCRFTNAPAERWTFRSVFEDDDVVFPDDDANNDDSVETTSTVAPTRPPTFNITGQSAFDQCLNLSQRLMTNYDDGRCYACSYAPGALCPEPADFLPRLNPNAPFLGLSSFYWYGSALNFREKSRG